MFTGTIQELADRLGVEYADAAGLLKFLRVKGIAKEVGKRPTGKRPQLVFEVPETVTLTVPAVKLAA